MAKGAEAKALMEGARRELEVVRRQATVQSLYSAPHASYMVCLPPPLLSPTPIPPPLPKMHSFVPPHVPVQDFSGAYSFSPSQPGAPVRADALATPLPPLQDLGKK